MSPTPNQKRAMKAASTHAKKRQAARSQAAAKKLVPQQGEFKLDIPKHRKKGGPV